MNNDEIFHILEGQVSDARAVECLVAYRLGKFSMADMAYYLSTVPGLREMYDKISRRAYF